MLEYSNCHPMMTWGQFFDPPKRKWVAGLGAWLGQMSKNFWGVVLSHNFYITKHLRFNPLGYAACIPPKRAHVHFSCLHLIQQPLLR